MEEIARNFPLEYLKDIVFENAYNACPAPMRAALKTALAFLHFRFGEQETLTLQRVNQHLGFSLNTSATPCPWALFILEEDFAAPARLLAAAAPAIFAHVPQLFFVIAPSKASNSQAKEIPIVANSACLVALELAGLAENACYVEDIPGLLQELTQTPGGRLLLFPAHKRSPFWDNLRSQARTLLPTGLQIFQDIPPRVYLGPEANAEVFHFAQPDAMLDTKPGYYQAFYGTQSPSSIQVAASFAPMLEACFSSPKLSPAFFMETSIQAFFHPDNG